MLRLVVTSLALLSLTACSSASLLKSTEPQQTIYSLRVAIAPAAADGGDARILEISKPSVPPGFETDRIALYMDDGRKLDYFSGAKWPDILDNVVQDFTHRSATDSLPYIVAITPTQALDADFRLQTKLNEFQPIYGASAMSVPRLVVDVEFTLIALPEERIIRSFKLSKQGTATSNRLDVVTAGLEKMLQEIEAEAFTKLDAHMRKPAALE